jgi:hypothetical protein
LGLAPRWQKYQQLISDTQMLLQQIAALPPCSLLPAALPTVTTVAPRAALALLVKQISSLAEQHNLCLIALQQPATAYQGGDTSTPLAVELVGSYQALLAFLNALRTTRHPLAIDSLLLQREEQMGEVKLMLGLSLTKSMEVP